MAMRNPYNYSMPKSALKFKSNLVQNKAADVNNAQTNKGQSKLNQYVEQKILTARPEDLTLMLYDGLIKFLKQAQMFMEQKNIEKTNNAIIRAQDIVNELNITLNMDYEVSKNLRSLYTYMNDRLIDANINKDNNSIEIVLGFAKELRDTWKTAMNLTHTNNKNG